MCHLYIHSCNIYIFASCTKDEESYGVKSNKNQFDGCGPTNKKKSLYYDLNIVIKYL